MTIRELQYAFQVTVNKYDKVGIIKSDVVFLWLNTAIIEYTNTLYSNNVESFEQSQKITDALKLLVEETIIDTAVDNSFGRENTFKAVLPLDYLHALNEEVGIIVNGDTKRVSITPTTSALLNKQLTDPYSSFLLHYESAKPLRIFTDVNVSLITDGNYTVDKYYLRYLRQPANISLTDDVNAPFNDFPIDAHVVIVELAAMLYLKSIGISTAPKEQDVQTKQ